MGLVYRTDSSPPALLFLASRSKDEGSQRKKFASYLLCGESVALIKSLALLDSRKGRGVFDSGM